MPARIPMPEGLGPHFRVAHGLARGVGRGRLNGGDLDRPFWGVRALAGAAIDIRGMSYAYAARMSPRAAFSHATAAQLWGIPLPLHLQQAAPLHVSVPHPHRAPEGVNVTGHRLHIDPADMRVLDGVAVTSLERTVFDLASALPDEDLLGALDNILWWRRSRRFRATSSSIEDALHRFGGRRGLGRLLDLLPLASDRSDSVPETVFRLRFVRAGLPPPIPNLEVLDAQGAFLAMPDLQLTEFRMAFDYEGDHHRTDARQWRKDLRRVPLLEDAGWRHTRLSADDLANSAYALTRARRLLVERGWTP
ncbi:MAG: hypothetical protein JWP19_1621 [Rhodoglobus sp.]|nr:hypothetical protein [Rhodoglobus sp.]